MSNVYVITNARLVGDVRSNSHNGKDYADCRVADNPIRKTDKDGQPIKSRFVTLRFYEGLARLAGKLSKGDVIVPVGELGIETYKDKNGVMQDKDTMRVSSFAVSKSDSFFNKTPEAQPDESAPQTDPLPF